MHDGMGEIAMQVGRRIRAERKRQGITLAELGGANLSRSFLSLVEQGRCGISLRALGLVAARLRMPLSYFVDGTLYPEAGDGYSDALVALESCLDSLERTSEDPAVLGGILASIGDVLRARGDIDRAIEQYNRARELFDAAGEGDRLAVIYADLRDAWREKQRVSARDARMQRWHSEAPASAC